MSKKPQKPAADEPIVPAGPLSLDSLKTLRNRVLQEEQMFAAQLAQADEGLKRSRGGIALLDKLIAAAEPGAGKEPA
jgi:hypothetical protein